MSSVNDAASAYVAFTMAGHPAVRRGQVSALDVVELLRAAFVAGVHHDVNERRAVYSEARLGEYSTRATVRAGAGFLGDPSSALVLRGRLLPGEPKPGHARQMIVTVDARRGLDHIVAVDVDGAELSRMLNDLNALVVYGGRNVDGR